MAEPQIPDTSVLDRETSTPLGAGGGMFCGVTQEEFAIGGVTYKWPKGSRLTWSIEFSRLGSLSDSDCKDAITECLKEPALASDISFEYVANPRAANIRMITTRLDGPSGVLADMQIPVGNVNGDTQLLGRFDDGENWGLFDNPPRDRIDFYRVALHELLHALGLGHKPPSIQAPALISPVYSPTMRHLQPADISELVRRYGAPKPPTEPPPPPPTGAPVTVTIEQSGKKWTGPVPRVA